MYQYRTRVPSNGKDYGRKRVYAIALTAKDHVRHFLGLIHSKLKYNMLPISQSSPCTCNCCSFESVLVGRFVYTHCCVFEPVVSAARQVAEPGARGAQEVERGGGHATGSGEGEEDGPATQHRGGECFPYARRSLKPQTLQPLTSCCRLFCVGLTYPTIHTVHLFEVPVNYTLLHA